MDSNSTSYTGWIPPDFDMPVVGLVNNAARVRASQAFAHHYLRPVDSCITQLKAQGPSRTCNESKEKEEDLPILLPQRQSCTSLVSATDPKGLPGNV